MNSKKAFSAFQVNCQDVWDADDGEYLRLISIKGIFNRFITCPAASKTASKVLESHRESMKSSSSGKSGHENLNSNSSAESSINMHGKNAPGMGVRLRASPDDQTVQQKIRDLNRVNRFHSTINSSVADLSSLRKLSWSGIPDQLRPTVWKLLCGYLPASTERRPSALTDKRYQYDSFVRQYFHQRNQTSFSPMHQQIMKDITRMSLLYCKPSLLDMFERILFIWSMRHPGSGYVQGINDLLTPFLVVFLSEHTKVDLTTSCELSLDSDLPPETLAEVEADLFWCLSHLLDTIQDNYTFAQPGIQNNISMMSSLIERIDSPLYKHLADHQVEFLQFAFRWMNNLLIRELPLRCIIRLWDTYLAEKSGFSNFHVYVCTAFLLQFSPELLRQRDFQEIIIMLQRLPTYHWTDEQISLILAEAYRLQSLFASAPHHLDFTPQTGLD